MYGVTPRLRAGGLRSAFNARLSAFRADPGAARWRCGALQRGGATALKTNSLVSPDCGPFFMHYILSRGHLGSGETLLTPLYLMLVRAAPPLIPVCVVEGVS